MRLTLRTLLAYLDDMLEDQDAAILKQKIEESSYATSLVARIQSTMDHADLSAISPDAVGPLENANIISEYLDSTLSAEQIAEIERVCLESDTSLAEAAACHQILTMVLGQPARVGDGLKERIYALPASESLRNMERQTERAPDANPSKTIATAETASYSSLEIPEGEQNEIDEAEMTSIGDSAIGAAESSNAIDPIEPVGPSDSGVADAPTRLRQSAGQQSSSGSVRAEAESVARATRAMMTEEGYGGLVRPSRITPWLVSLALAAALLYALGQIFSPLIDKRIADRESAAETTSTLAEPNTTEAILDAPRATNESETPVVKTPAVEAAEQNATAPEPTEPEPTESEATDPIATDPKPSEPEPVMTEPAMTEPAAETDAANPADVAEPNADAAEPMPMEAESPDTKVTDVASTDDDTPAPPVVAAQPANQSGKKVAELMTGQSVVLVADNQPADAKDDIRWRRLWPAKDDEDAKADAPADANQRDRVRQIKAGQTVIAPALYRPILMGDEGVEWTLAGPTRLTLSKNQPATEGFAKTITNLLDGRLLLASTDDKVTAELQLGTRTVQVSMPMSQTVLAIETVHVRPTGMDPQKPDNRMPISRVIVVQGSAKLSSADDADESEPVELSANQQWQARGSQAGEVSDVERLPNWIDPPEKADLLVNSAREGLLEFVNQDGSVADAELEKSLREAMAFRRVEVAALAAQTLLLLGRADVYFGGNGILSSPRQRLYFTEHFQQLRQHMATSADAAKAIDDAIHQAERADGDRLYELLVGYNNEQLAAGADAKLIEDLNSGSMSVRVLAIENLRSIVGDTLGYRADQENAVRRTNDIKKWQARLRRGDIRYPAAPAS